MPCWIGILPGPFSLVLLQIGLDTSGLRLHTWGLKSAHFFVAELGFQPYQMMRWSPQPLVWMMVWIHLLEQGGLAACEKWRFVRQFVHTAHFGGHCLGHVGCVKVDIVVLLLCVEHLLAFHGSFCPSVLTICMVRWLYDGRGVSYTTRWQQ